MICQWNYNIREAPLNKDLLFVIDDTVKFGQRGIYTKDDFECTAEVFRDGQFEVYEKQWVLKWMLVPGIED